MADEGHQGSLAYYDLRNRREAAPLLDWLMAVIDHVEAFSTGGAHAAENFVTACNKCNARKSASRAEAFQAKSPLKPVKGKYGEPTAWDGFSALFVLLATRYEAVLTVSEREWLAALADRS